VILVVVLGVSSALLEGGGLGVRGEGLEIPLEQLFFGGGVIMRSDESCKRRRRKMIERHHNLLRLGGAFYQESFHR